MFEFERVTRPHLRLEPSDVPGWWKVMLVPADRRETTRLSSWPTRSEAAEAAKAEAEHRGLPVPAAALMGGANV